MKCLVTGGAGFIGSHLCDKLLQTGHEVICIDNLITGSEKNISHINSPKFRFLNHDITKQLPDDLTADIIFHLASPASPPKYIKYAVETLLTNTYGTYLLLENAKIWQARFIYASTSEVYGDPTEHPQRENYWGNVNPNGERSCYDEGKRAGEAFVMSYIRNFKIKATIIRIFNTYGPRMDPDDGRVVTNFIRELKSKEALTIYGDGSQTRSFCYITDLINGIIKIFESNSTDQEIINLGNPEEISIRELANLLIRLSGQSSDIVFQKIPPDDPTRRCPDITKAKRLLDWQPIIGLEEGINKTLQYYFK